MYSECVVILQLQNVVFLLIFYDIMLQFGSQAHIINRFLEKCCELN